LPSASDVQKVVSLIEKGYGFVALYRFAFFGFKKELFRQIGPMDERFVGGGYEDDDFYIRLHEANISMYINEEIPYTKSHSSWNYSRSKVHFVNKWVDTSSATYNPDAKLSHNPISRKLQEEIYNYDLGASIPTSFLSWDYTFCPIAKPRKYMKAPKNPKEIK
jgi:GT2 family glycosyltransferase